MSESPPRSTPAVRPAVLAVAALLLLGAGLRTAQFAARPSLYDGEIRVARNVEARGLLELVATPMDHQVVAPPGFLAAVEAATTVFGTGERALRLAPWLLGLAGLFLFWRVSRPGLSRAAVLAGLCLFAVSPALVWYGAAVKQYVADVTVTLFLVWLALRFRDRPDEVGFAIAAGAVGGASLTLSHPAVPTAFCLTCVLSLEWLRKRPRPSLAPLGILVGLWGGVGLGASIAAWRLIASDTLEGMQWFWTAGGFPPPLSDGFDLLLWLPRQLVEVFAHFLVYQYRGLSLVLVALPVVLATIGFVFLARRHPWRAAILTAPIAAGLLVAVLHVLPFRNRVALYAGWPMLVFSMWGIEAIRSAPAGGRRKAAWAAGLAAAPVLLFLTVMPPPYSKHEARPVIEEIARRSAPGDAIYVLCMHDSDQPMAYYGPRAGIESWTEGSCGVPGRETLDEIEALASRHDRLWLFQRPNETSGSAAFERFLPGEARPYDFWAPVRDHLAPRGTVVDSILDPLGTRRTPPVALLVDMEADEGGGSTADPRAGSTDRTEGSGTTLE